MLLVACDARLAVLAHLDVVDVLPDGRLRLNESFVDQCVHAYDTDPACLGSIVQDLIVQRAVARGYAGCVDAEGLALTALELGAADEQDARA